MIAMDKLVTLPGWVGVREPGESPEGSGGAVPVARKKRVTICPTYAIGIALAVAPHPCSMHRAAGELWFCV